MILSAVLATLLLQGSQPTVGDTIWLTHAVAVPPGYVVRASDWDPADPVEVLGRPRVVITGDSARISYPAVIWTPGPQQIELPGPLLLGPGGKVDSLPGETVRIAVRSVLPRGVPDSLIPPQPRATLVTRRDTSPVPLIILWLLALAVLVPVHLWWRRRGKPLPVALPLQELPEPPLDRWADDGEYRAVANVAAVRLRTSLAQRVAAAHSGLDTERLLAQLAAARPDWPLDELGDLLRALDDARFGHAGSPEALELSRSTLEMRDRLLREAA
jgi:hypothetical protein